MTNRGRTLSEKIGPWRRKDYESFLALDVDLHPPIDYFAPAPRNALSGLHSLAGLLSYAGDQVSGATLQGADRQEQARLITEAWKVRRAHPIYRWLTKQEPFERAWKVFEQHRRKATTGELALPHAPFRFLKEFIECAGFAYERRDARKRGLLRRSNYGPFKRRRDSAIDHATALRELLDSGIALRDHAKTEHLRALLLTLCNELSAMKRKPRVERSDGGRWALKILAISLRSSCGLKSPAMLMHFASMVDIRCDAKTAQRYSDEADRRYRELLAEALMRRTASGTEQGQKAA